MMVDLFKELEENAKYFKEYKDIRIALDICTEYMDDQRKIVNNALDRIKTKEVLLNLEIKNYEEDMLQMAEDRLPNIKGNKS
tara:strand:- start:63 stop:308 length:246 start_codon:yes stop_codon:yes gene_type:complete